ncbi:MAG: type II toxin-antitoxin system HicB family antitoxin [Candidatus Yanofskybacteria bacterium]|nr:type II toxin-antitoxin system HicB family antitoxin [Candidatus Yanofskybacteria bacterium]
MAKNIKTTEYSYTVIYEPIKDGGYQVTVPLLPGLVTYGRSLDEAQEMAQDAILCYLESLQKDKEQIPSEKSLIQERMTVSLGR